MAVEPLSVLISTLLTALGIGASTFVAWRVAKYQINDSNDSFRKEIDLYQRLAKRETLTHLLEMMVMAYRDFTEYDRTTAGKHEMRNGAIARFNALITAVQLDDSSRNTELKELSVNESTFSSNMTKAVEIITKELKSLAE